MGILLNIIRGTMWKYLVTLSTPFCSVDEINIVIKLCLEPWNDNPFEYITNKKSAHRHILKKVKKIALLQGIITAVVYMGIRENILYPGCEISSQI
jgi:hypothetical protein